MKLVGETEDRQGKNKSFTSLSKRQRIDRGETNHLPVYQSVWSNRPK